MSISIDEFKYDAWEQIYYYPCRCGDRYEIKKRDLDAGKRVAKCPSCQRTVRVMNDYERAVNPHLKI